MKIKSKDLLEEWYDPKYPTSEQQKKIEQERQDFEDKIKERMKCEKCREIMEKYKSNSNWLTGCFECTMKDLKK